MKNLGVLHPTDVLPNASTDSIVTAVVGASSGHAFDTPTGAGYVAFGNNIDIFVCFGSTNASIPTTDSLAGTTKNLSVLNPTARNIGSTLSCTGLSIISPSSGYIVMEWYKP